VPRTRAGTSPTVATARADAQQPLRRQGASRSLQRHWAYGHPHQLGGKNVFIAECKFDKGAASVTKTVDQLFGYTTWRDVKLAIVLFVDRVKITDSVATAKATLAAHEQFRTWLHVPNSRKPCSGRRWRGRVTTSGSSRRTSQLPKDGGVWEG
jgi:hypothetical protein